MTIAPLNGDTRPARPPVLEVAARLGLAAVLAWPLALAWLAPELPAVLTLSAILVLLLALWRPAVALVATTALVPAGLLLADAPASAAETIAWAFLCGWLLAARRPLGMPGPTRLGAWTALYAACLSVSWVRLALVSAHGVDASVLPLYLLRALTPDHLIFSSPEPETWNLLHALTGVGLFVAALTLSRVERRLPGWIAVTLVASASVLGVLTLAGAIGGWNASDDPWRYLSRFISGSRYSLHLTDYNAAGSSYVLAGLTAVGLARVARWRVVAGAAVVLMLPALVMSGSRSAALGAIVVGALALWGGRRAARAGSGGAGVVVDLSPRTAGLWFGGLVATLLAVGVASAWLNPNPTGSASASLQFRTEFAATSARMLASAPVGGVGIGQYYPRSHEYMSDELRAYYPYENAHNYFLQAFAELGLLGGALFLSVVATGLRLGWSALRAQPASPALSGLFAGCCGYLLTCVTGHPLLVPEAALPFWAAFGAMAGASPAGGTAPAPWFRKGAAAAATVLGVLLVLALVESRRQPGIPADRGFHDERVADDGTRFRWSTRHAVAWLQGDPGFLTLLVRAPELPGRPRPFIVQLEADGHVLQRTPVPTDRWLQIGAPVPRRPDGARRRIDLRVNQVWTERRDRPGPGVTDDRPLGVMVGYPNLQEVPK